MERDQLGGSNFIGKVSVDSQSQWAEVGRELGLEDGLKNLRYVGHRL